MAEETLRFETEVGRILHIVANSLYSEKQVFLRELISNAADACDRLRYLALTDAALTEGDAEFSITLTADKEARTLTVADNGVGMNREALIKDLGTIARSGSGAFLEQLSGDAKKDVALIGQFGVGFYSAFMVADKVEVVSKRAGEDQAWKWTSDGLGEFTVVEAEKPGRGTAITLHLKEDEGDYLEPARLRHIVTTYSNHIPVPIVIAEGDDTQTINAASAIWTRPRGEITEEEYTEFYRHIGRAFDAPWLTVHWRAEGMMEYTGLLFVPEQRPLDIFSPDREHGVKLYVRRVFVTDKCEGLVPPWLRFLRGLIDSEDLPLNVSREMLQHNPMLTRIRGAIVTRALGELEKKAEADAEAYGNFWEQFGPVLKEGIYEDMEHRDRLMKLARFRSTAGDGLVSLAEYIERMKPGQEAIYTISGENLETLRKSPQLEGFRARGVDVLLLTDPVDDFWLPQVFEFDGKPFKSATRSGSDLAGIAKEGEDAKPEGEAAEKETPPGTDALIAMVKLELGEAVKDVRASERLTESAVCLVSDEGDMDINLERLLRQHKQLEQSVPRVLEINAEHPLIRTLAAQAGKDGAGETVAAAAWLLLDQARILGGEPPADPTAFARRLSEVMTKAMG